MIEAFPNNLDIIRGPTFKVIWIEECNFVPIDEELYDLREHSMRKYFKTQMIALGVQPDYVDYMMGHIPDTYNDIQSNGIEFLRNVYQTAGLSIRPKIKVSKIDALKEIIRAWGMNPEQLLTRQALAEGAITNQEEVIDKPLAVLGQELKRLIKLEATV
jgi:hypothetical protein